ncbi:MAG TPA: MutH/Sau3AI family endonuclease [Polyangia bacterium]|jgi:DNA mismatch repair protein|nr:MutH/Sau3AI family endonuclease [Polyangia bacterium]
MVPITEREQLLAHAHALVGVTLAELADGLGLPVPAGHVHTKGWSGQIIERELGAGDGPGRGQDFAALGIELKTVPVDRDLVPRESTAVCQIDPIVIAGESWETSYLRQKLSQVLWVGLEVSDDQGSIGDRRVVAVRLWTPSPNEQALLRADFELFVRSYFRRGRGAAITGHQGQVLQVRPKGRNAADQRRAFGPTGEPTQIGKCGFYLRPAFVARILRGK